MSPMGRPAGMDSSVVFGLMPPFLLPSSGVELEKLLSCWAAASTRWAAYHTVPHTLHGRAVLPVFCA